MVLKKNEEKRSIYYCKFDRKNVFSSKKFEISQKLQLKKAQNLKLSSKLPYSHG